MLPASNANQRIQHLGAFFLPQANWRMQMMMLESMIAAYTMSTMSVDGTRPSEPFLGSLYPKSYAHVEISFNCYELFEFEHVVFWCCRVASSTIYFIKRAGFCQYQPINIANIWKYRFWFELCTDDVQRSCCIRACPILSRQMMASGVFRRHRILGLLLCKATMAPTEHWIQPVGSFSMFQQV